jgi:ABC-type dipeptide/oligopeptide/nickel transport system permease component
MNREFTLSLMKKLVYHVLILVILLVVVIVATGFPMNFDVEYQHGEYLRNMSWEDIQGSISQNFRSFFSGEFIDMQILSTSPLAILAGAFRLSFVVLFFGTLLALLVGIPKGIVDSRKKRTAGTFKLLQSYIPLSFPDVLTISLVQLGAIYLYYNEIAFLGLGPIPFLGDGDWYQSIFPIISISVLPAAYISRVTANTIESLQTRAYIVTARGKGCSSFQILKKHMMKNITFEVLSIFPTVMGMMFASLIIVERLFYYQGMGYHLIYIYTTSQLTIDQARVVFTLFTITLALFYYLIYLLLKALKARVLPKLKEN